MLSEDIEDYIAEKDLEKDCENNYRRSVRFFGEHLGRPATREDLQERIVNRWLKSVSLERSPSTVMGHRRSITALWNWLYEQQLVAPYDPRRLRQIKIDYPPPRAWSHSQLRILLKAAGEMRGVLRSGVLARDLMTACVMLGYTSGLRPKDQLLLTKDNLTGTRLTLVQNKTGHPHSIDVGRDVADSLAKLDVCGSEYLIPVTKRTMRTWCEKLFALAELQGFTKRRGESLGHLRKSGATEVARQHGLEAAAKFLGHKSGTEIARRHYVEPSALGDTPRPPSFANVGRRSTRSRPRRIKAA